MARRLFYSFHYEADATRAAQIRSMGVVDGNRPATDNHWEEVTRGGDRAIELWIADQMYGKSCVVVLIGSETAGRKWVNYEIGKAWDDGLGLFGIYIHRMKNLAGEQGSRGRNPFEDFKLGRSARLLSEVVPAHDPPYSGSRDAYAYIKENLADWIEQAIEIRLQS